MSCEESRLQNGGLTLLLISLPADSTTASTTNIALFPVISSEQSESRNLFRHARPDRASFPSFLKLPSEAPLCDMCKFCTRRFL